MIQFKGGAGVLGCSISKSGMQVAAKGIHPGREEAILLPPGEYTVDLIQRDWTGPVPRELHREQRTVNVVAGEVVDVVYSR